MKCKIEISARHIHLTQNDYETLFGDTKPIEIKKLGQGEIACDQTVTIVGKKSEIPGVRLLIPFRRYSQVEISRTDAINLGIDAPLKVSGDLPGAEIKIIGPAGEITKEIAIVAKRHIHISPRQAEALSLNINDEVSVKVLGERGLVFENVIVRIEKDFSETVHLDTDEGNAAGVTKDSEGEVIVNFKA